MCKNREEYENGKMSDKVNPHSIQIFVDDKGHIYFIPMLYTKAGFGMETEYYRELQPPYSLTDIGRCLLCVWNDMKLLPVLDEMKCNIATPAHKIITGGKGYLAFQQRRQMICVTFRNEIDICYWYRQKRGFGVNKDDREIRRSLPLSSTAIEIGTAIDGVFFAFNHCHIPR